MKHNDNQVTDTLSMPRELQDRKLYFWIWVAGWVQKDLHSFQLGKILTNVWTVDPKYMECPHD